MKIVHYITLDRGSGPVSLVEITAPDGATAMLRVIHNAKFDKVTEVDAVATRRSVDAASDLGNASTKVPHELGERLAQEVLRWVLGNGGKSHALRWGEDGLALLFGTEADASAWDESNQQDMTLAEPRRRQRIVG